MAAHEEALPEEEEDDLDISLTRTPSQDSEAELWSSLPPFDHAGAFRALINRSAELDFTLLKQEGIPFGGGEDQAHQPSQQHSSVMSPAEELRNVGVMGRLRRGHEDLLVEFTGANQENEEAARRRSKGVFNVVITQTEGGARGGLEVWVLYGSREAAVGEPVREVRKEACATIHRLFTSLYQATEQHRNIV